MTAGADAARGGELGVLGGTFNPIHLGHLRAAEEAAELLGLERVLFVPSADPPHKSRAEGVIASARDRLAWVEAAIADNERFAADPLELERKGPSYAVDTLTAIAERVAPGHPVFLIGDEAFVEIGSWRDPERLLELAHFAVLRRPASEAKRPKGRLTDWLPASLAGCVEWDADGRSARVPAAGTWLRELEIAGLDVSATEIRRRIRAGRSTRYLVPEAARLAILGSGAYAMEEAQAL